MDSEGGLREREVWEGGGSLTAGYEDILMFSVADI